MKNLVLLQIFMYLFISPMVLISVSGENYLISISIVFLAGFLFGVFNSRRLSHSLRSQFYIPPAMFTSWLKFLLICLTVAYIYVVIDQGLMSRRLGSDVVAEMAANMPIYYKLIMRVYEVAFYPVLFVLLSGLACRKPKYSELILLIMLIIGFLFTGVLDSRMKLIFPILFYYVFFISPRPVYKPIPKSFFFLGGIVLVAFAVVIGMGRIQNFSGIEEYLLNDLVRRVDGLELITRVDNEVNIPLLGTHDVKMWVNVIAMIPFLEEAKSLKLLGLTSTKSYFLQVVLGTKEFDSNDTVVTDLYYFGGHILTFFGAMLYGYLVRKMDSSVRHASIWKSRKMLAFMCAFFINGWQLENGYTGMVISTTRDFIILYMLFAGLRFFKCNKCNVTLSR